MKGLGGIPDSLVFGPRSGGVVRLTDKGTLGCSLWGKHSRQKAQPGEVSVREETPCSPKRVVQGAAGGACQRLNDFGVGPGAVGCH